MKRNDTLKIKQSGYVVVDPKGKEVDGFLHDTRHKAMNSVWDQAIAECGYSVKRVNRADKAGALIVTEIERLQRKDQK
jgi:hypothetical protein